MTFTEAVRSGLTNYAVFTGRASRSAYWYFVLFQILVSTIASAIDGGLGMQLVAPLASLGLLLPSLGVGVRRLHDIGKSWKWMLLILIPILGWIYLVYLMIQPSEGANAYGSPA
ncbi:MAG: DUF805 domain-containing protein [Dehalococcoidia bacterium]|nr:MAG: DUF805 domain-containing protein [Dehalococcoidia bacterium]